MLLSVARFELRYQLRSPAFWVTFLLFFLLAFGAAASDKIRIGGNGGNVLVNAPFVIVQIAMVLSVFCLFVVAAFVANAVVRDDETRFGGLLHSTRLTRTDYLLGRFAGAWAVGMLVFASVPLGNLVGAAMPWVDPETVGPVHLAWYLQAWLLFCGPTLLVMSAALFALAIATRSMMATYVGVVVFLVLYLVAMGLLDQPRFETAVALGEPFGMAALGLTTKYWTAAERNTLMPALAGVLLWNRLLWLVLSGGILALAVQLYRIEGRPAKARKVQRVTVDALPAATVVPTPTGNPGGWAAVRALVRFDMAATFRNPGYVVLVFFGCVNAAGALWFASQLYDTDTLPVTRVMIDALRGSFTVIPLIIAVYYAGELVWGSRDQRTHEVLDATPAPDWAFALPKILAITLVLVSTLVGSVLAALVVQLLKGYTHLELLHYCTWYVLPESIEVTLFAVLAVFVQTLVPNKQAGWLVMLVFVISQSTLGNLGFEHHLYQYASAPRVPLSDMNAQGQFAAHAAWFRAYWSAFALVLVVLSQALWRRGTVVLLGARLRRLPARLAGPAGVVAGSAVLLMAGLGGYIYYNTNVLNPYRTAEAEDRWTADKEKATLPFELLAQPRIRAVVLDVALYPAQSRVVTHGSYVLENRSGAPITTVHVNLPRDLQVTQMALEGATLAQELALFNYRIYRFAQPLAPGGQATLRFATVRAQRGFRNRGNETRVVDNGTFIDNSEITPTLGTNRSDFLSDRIKRRKYGLPAELRPAKLEDEAARGFNMLRRDSDWVDADLTVSTVADQLVIAPGYQVAERVENGRRIARYRTDAPIQNFFSIQSARYQVARDQWHDVQLAVYHDPAHDHNTALMIEAMKRSLDVFSAAFSPFQFRQLRILEFPAYATFAQSFANTIPYAESIGFILNRKDPDDIDMVSYVTAHEVGHQWWGHQLISADQQGGTFLVESMAQYSALLVMEQLYGRAQIRKFLKLEMDRYLRARGGERLEELPLERVENQPYIHYQKGGLALYLLKEELGEAVVNHTLQRLLKEYAFKAAPYPNPRDFLRLLREEAGPGHEQLISDLFERITLHDLKAVQATTHQLPDGQWETTLQVTARKLYADGTGKETETPFQAAFAVGLFTAEPGKKGFKAESVLLLRRESVHNGAQRIVLRSATAPAYAGIDPYNTHIDRNTDDNVVAVQRGP